MIRDRGGAAAEIGHSPAVASAAVRRSVFRGARVRVSVCPRVRLACRGRGGLASAATCAQVAARRTGDRGGGV